MDLTYQFAEDGIFQPSIPIQHRDDEYPEDGFATLWAMQQRHFWYRGRHCSLLHALDKHRPTNTGPLSAVDLGGGVGGWVRYLADQRARQYEPLALADSSRTALQMDGEVLPEGVERYQIDLTNLGWNDQWDVSFMRDVIEHLPDDLGALRQARTAIKQRGKGARNNPCFSKALELQ